MSDNGLLPEAPGAKVTEALGALAFYGGNLAATERATGIADATLFDWRERYPQTYHEIRQQIQRQLEERTITAWTDINVQALRVVSKGLSEAERQLDAQDDKQPAATARNAAVVAGVAVDKRRLEQERPTALVRNFTLEESVQALKRKLQQARVVDAEVVEEEAPKLPPAADAA